MVPRTLKDWLLCALIVTTIVVIAIPAAHMPGWCKGMDHLITEAQDGAGKADSTLGTIESASQTIDAASKSIATDVRRDVIVAGGAERMTELTMRELHAKLPTLLDSLTTSTKKLGDVEDAAKETIGKTGETVEALRETAEASSGTITQLGETASSLTDLSASIRTQIESPENTKLRDSATAFLQSYTALGNGLTTATGHIDARFFAPYSGTHPKLHTFWNFTSGALGLGARAGEAGYYGVGIAHGQ